MREGDWDAEKAKAKAGARKRRREGRRDGRSEEGETDEEEIQRSPST